MREQTERTEQVLTAVGETPDCVRKPWQAPALSELAMSETRAGGPGTIDGGIFS
ncbi:hypothetical protein [Oleisolibacter albus]|uniref:hypothetical protein n=1 Tax=Oleisolibacter albus TaxID=2171757 RepID=UPI001875626C|nr:hypothetical protein [Oleisolibacter albus]